MSDDSYYPDATADPDEPEAIGPEVLGKDAAQADEKSVFSAAIFHTTIIHELNDPKSPLSYLIAKARTEAIAALDALMHENLFSTDGMTRARQMQGQARKYFELVDWLRAKARESEDEDEPKRP